MSGKTYDFVDLSRDDILPVFGKQLITEFYLEKGETSPQEGFARAANAYSFGDEEFAKRIYDYASRNWFMYASPVLSNAPFVTYPHKDFHQNADWLEQQVKSGAIKLRGQPISCFVAGTPVLTNFGMTKIEDLCEGDSVLTHKGRFRKILATKVSQSDDIYELKVSKMGTVLRVTGNHLFLTNTGWKRVDELSKVHDLIASDYKANWEEFDHTIHFLENNPSKFGARTQLPDSVFVDVDLAWALGFWFAEGSVHENGTVKVTHGIRENCEKWVAIMNAKFGCNGTIEAQRTWFNGRVHSKNLMEWFNESFGRGCKEKTLTDWIVSLPKDKLQSFYDGLYEGDGYKTIGTRRGLGLTNPKLIAGVHLILMKLGIRHSMQLAKKTSNENLSGLIYHWSDDHNFERSTNSKARGIVFHDGLSYLPIESIKRIDTGKVSVYDIQVEEDESFSVAGLIAHNCFLQYQADTREGIVDTWSETAYLTYLGGGIGIHCMLRTNEGKSTGAMANMHVTDSQMLACKQGDVRRGSAAVYLSVRHPEFREFLNMRRVGGKDSRKNFNLHNAVRIPDEFMQAVVEDKPWTFVDPNSGKEYDTVSARTLWREILEVRSETGEPYFFFEDTANRALPESQKKLGLKINGSNLCVAPETKILTKHLGWVSIESVANIPVDVWNGQKWVTVTPQKTGTQRKLLRVILSCGDEIECTEQHKWHVVEGYTGRTSIKETHELESGDKLIKFDLPVMFDGRDSTVEDLNEMYWRGFYQGDGCEAQGYNRVYFYGNKKTLAPAFERHFEKEIVYKTDQEYQDRIYYHLKKNWSKTFVPTEKSTMTEKLSWFAGLCDADGTITRNGDNESLQLCSVDLSFLRKIRLMLQTLGVNTKIAQCRIEGNYKLPDGVGGLKEYPCQTAYRLLVSSSGLYQLATLGFTTERLSFVTRKPQRNAEQFVTVVDVVDDGRVDDTFCYTEPETNLALFNGVMTGNCNEIYLATNEERTAVCCLSSVNLEKLEEWKDHPMFIADLVRFLDNVLEFFIRTAPKEVHKAIYSATRERALGLGAMGFHSLLQSKMIPFESGGLNSAAQLNGMIFNKMKKQAVEASKQLAIERGEPEDMKGTGLRNSHILAIAPNSNNSAIVGTSPSIEPWDSNYFVSQTRAGDHVVKNRYLEALLESKGLNTPDTWKSIAEHDGSVQHIKELTDEERNVFKTAMEINQLWVIEHAATRQQFLCQGQSTNLFFPAGAPKSYIERVHFHAWKKGLKGLYYFRTKSKVKAEKVQKEVAENRLVDGVEQAQTGIESGDKCLSCEG